MLIPSSAQKILMVLCSSGVIRKVVLKSGLGRLCFFAIGVLYGMSANSQLLGGAVLTECEVLVDTACTEADALLGQLDSKGQFLRVAVQVVL